MKEKAAQFVELGGEIYQVSSIRTGLTRFTRYLKEQTGIQNLASQVAFSLMQNCSINLVSFQPACGCNSAATA